MNELLHSDFDLHDLKAMLKAELKQIKFSRQIARQGLRDTDVDVILDHLRLAAEDTRRAIEIAECISERLYEMANE